MSAAVTAGTGRVGPALLLGVPLALAGAKLHGLYDRDELVIRKGTIEESPRLAQLSAGFTIAVWVLDGPLLHGSLEAGQGLLVLLSFWAFALVLRRALRSVAARRAPVERLLMIGDVDTYRRLEDKIGTGMIDATLVGRMSLSRVKGRGERTVDERALGAVLAECAVERVLVVPSQTDPHLTIELVRVVKALGLRVSLVPQVLDVVGSAVVFDDICGMTLLGVRQLAITGFAARSKRALDLAGAGFGLLLAAPVMIAAAIAIKLDSRGPVLFRQERIGRDGRPFAILKFRSMVVDAEERKAKLCEGRPAGGLFKLTDDPRVTRVGRLLRRTSLDELPQLLNVVRGEMSLVGPRPLVPTEDGAITGHDRRRLSLTPGITGHWQILGSQRVPLQEMLKIDYVYVTTWSPIEDFKILVRTLSYMVARRGV